VSRQVTIGKSWNKRNP